MAWQLHYTSARRGPTGRAGFQFVAQTPGLPDGVRAAVTPYLSYRPPPDAPLSPDDAELGRFPVSLLYDVVAGRRLLLRCRYLGRDYSGRYGNFFAHAVVAEPDELEGLRPAELWHAAHWAAGPAPDGVLDPLEELTPGAALEPAALAAWLATAGPADPYALLARLLDAVADVLGRGHGRVVLVADDAELVARWIAVVSYSLPVEAAARLSFVTYAGDPAGAAQRLVGTTPAAWEAVRHHAPHAPVFDLHTFDPHEFDAREGGRASRFARTVADRWRAADFGGLDALGELAPLDDPAREGAAALLALCRADATVTAGEQDAAAELLARRGAGIPGWVWEDLSPGVPAMGLGLALTVHSRALEAGADGVARQCALRVGHLVSERLARASGPAEVAEAVRAAAPAGVAPDPAEVTAAAARCVRAGSAELAPALAACPAGLRGAFLDGAIAAAGTDRGVLTARNCDLLYEHAERLRAVPGVAAGVLASVGRRRPDRRIAVTGELLRLAGDAAAAGAVPDDMLGAALEEVWGTPPSAGECLGLLDAHGPHPALAALPSRTFTRLAFPGGRRLADPVTQRLAARVRDAGPAGRAARDAALVQAFGTAVEGGPKRAARALADIADADGATPQLAGEAFAGAARRLGERPPRFRAELLAAVPAPVRARLAESWTAELPRRARTGRGPLLGADIGRRNELVEVVLRLRERGVAEPSLEAWARAAAGRWLAGRQLDAHLARAPELRAALRDLRTGTGPGGGR